MNENELIERLEKDVQDAPSIFHNAMLGAFEQIQEQAIRENNITKPSYSRFKRRTTVGILIAALLMVSVALAAALVPNILAVFWGDDVIMSKEFPSQVQSDIVEITVGDCRVRIEEAVYDGVSLYVTYSVRNMSVDHLMGTHFREAPEGVRQLVEEDYEEIRSWEVGYWSDRLWINGKDMDMPETAVIELGGDEPGEYVVSNMYHIGMMGIALDGEARISLPIGKKQVWDYETYQTLPRDADGGIREPEEGCVTFYVSAEELDVERVKDGPVSLWPDGTEVWTTEASFTPIKLYLTLNYHIPDEQVEAYKQAMGSDGFYYEGKLVHTYSALDVAHDWISSFTLTDAEGNLTDVEFSIYDGCYAMKDTICQYIFPYMEEYPSPLYVAPLVDGVPDMTRRVLVRE